MRNILFILSAFLLFACKDKDNGNSIPSSDYELSPDGLTLVKWKNENTTAVDMQADPVLSKVQVIGEKAFYIHKNIVSITLPTNLKRIEKEAFWYTKITSITIPTGVQVIKEFAFGSSSLTSVQFSEGLISIEKGAFYSCEILSLKFPESLQAIGESAFWGNRGLISITIPKGVQNIGTESFFACSKLTTATFRGINPPRVKDPFNTLINPIARIYVPKGRLEVYKNDEGFKRYSNVLTEEE